MALPRRRGLERGFRHDLALRLDRRQCADRARADRRDTLARQLVSALIERVTSMAAHPMPAHLVRRHGGIELLPEIDVLDRLLVGGAPAVALPAMNPLHDAVAQILAIGMEIDQAGPLQGLQGPNRSQEFHALVGGVRLAALELLLVVAEGKDRAPAARPRIAGTGSVGV